MGAKVGRNDSEAGLTPFFAGVCALIGPGLGAKCAKRADGTTVCEPKIGGHMPIWRD
jgi:hypothetical protein